jgi:hypothetical protein
MAIVNKVNNSNTELDNYKVKVSERFDTLDSEEQSTLLSMYGTPELMVVAKIIGPEVHGILSEKLNTIMNSTQNEITVTPKRGLAARK